MASCRKNSRNELDPEWQYELMTHIENGVYYGARCIEVVAQTKHALRVAEYLSMFDLEDLRLTFSRDITPVEVFEVGDPSRSQLGQCFPALTTLTLALGNPLIFYQLLAWLPRMISLRELDIIEVGGGNGWHPFAGRLNVSNWAATFQPISR